MTLKRKRDMYELQIRVPFTQESGGLELSSSMNSGATHPHYLKIVFEMFVHFFCHVPLVEEGT